MKELTLLILPFIFNGFVQKWFIPQGTIGTAGRICIGDTDRDGHYEFIFSTYGGSYTIYFYELHLPDTWEVDSFPYLYSPLVWDIGDFDIDGLADLPIQASATESFPTMILSIAESPDSFSYPTQEVWRDTVGPAQILPVSSYDIDQDGIPEIVKNRAIPYGDIGIYESIGDNQYALIFADDPDTSGFEAPAATHAFGDFDSDGNIECVFAGGDEWYWVYESPANNTYEKVSEDALFTSNIRDCFAVLDADGDGKLEFVVKGFYIIEAEIHAFILEAIADNTYAIIKTLTLPGGDYGGGYSDAGDVDGDSIPEIVLEARQNVFVIKSVGNDSFYIWDTLPGNNSGSNVRVFDLDENGLAEIVISGNNETRIYEYEPGGVEEYTSGKPVNIGFTCLPNVVENDISISFVLPEPDHISLSIYNNLGQRVKSICTGRQTAGCHSQKIDLTAFAAGIYFVQLETPDQVIIQKVVKIR